MELILRVEKLGGGQFMDADSGKDITVTGKVLSLHFQDGISEGFQDYAGGSNARTTIKDS